MYVYIAKFVNRPGLVKIGFSELPRQRAVQLEPHHGRGTILESFYAGYKPKFVELRVHREFKEFKRPVSGIGGSEFFCESIVPDVIMYIRNFHLPVKLEQYLLDEQNELKRCMEFSRKLLPVPSGKDKRSNMTFNSDKFRICLGVQILMEHGMSRKDAFSCYAGILKEKLGVNLTGWRLHVAICCAGTEPRGHETIYTRKYRIAKLRRAAMEVNLDVEERKL